MLNGGGDCAGLNAVTRGVLAAAMGYGDEVIGVRNGWAGLLSKDVEPISYSRFEDAIGEGGTLLGTSRTNPMKRQDGLETVMHNLKETGADALIAVGGDDTLGVALELHRRGTKVVGVPKTIDNDLAGTDFSFGFFSAVDEAMRLLESLKTTGRSHGRVMVAEVMGRDAGWITLYAGTAAGCDLIIIPEFPMKLEEIVEFVRQREKKGKRSTMIAVAEGVKLVSRNVQKDEFGHELVAKAVGESNASYLARVIEEGTGLETRATVLGHTIRGSRANAYDRVMTSMLGIRAVEAVHGGRFGIMLSIRGAGISEVPLDEGVKKKFVDRQTWETLRKFFI